MIGATLAQAVDDPAGRSAPTDHFHVFEHTDYFARPLELILQRRQILAQRLNLGRKKARSLLAP